MSYARAHRKPPPQPGIGPRDCHLREVGHVSLTSLQRGAKLRSGIARQSRFQSCNSLNLAKSLSRGH
eukprot:6196109-Pleurochrysis_carterae.AAC.2